MTENLLNSTAVPVAGIEIFDFRGIKVKIKVRCELCAFAEVIEDTDSLFCTKLETYVLDDFRCGQFNITNKMMDDIYNGCIK